jgi:hypothetical protein
MLIVLIQDIFSYNVEQSKGDTHNMIPVVMNERGLDLQSAVDFVGEMCKSTIDRFISERDNLPSWGPEIDRQVKIYVQGLADWIVGSLHWSFESTRYFGTNGRKIKQTRIVELLPLRPEARVSVSMEWHISYLVLTSSKARVIAIRSRPTPPPITIPASVPSFNLSTATDSELDSATDSELDFATDSELDSPTESELATPLDHPLTLPSSKPFVSDDSILDPSLPVPEPSTADIIVIPDKNTALGRIRTESLPTVAVQDSPSGPVNGLPIQPLPFEILQSDIGPWQRLVKTAFVQPFSFYSLPLCVFHTHLGAYPHTPSTLLRS